MKRDEIGDLEFWNRSDGSASVLWSRRSEPSRRFPVALNQAAPRAARWFGWLGLLTVVPAIGAVVAGARLLQGGDWVLGGLALAAGLLLGTVAAVLAAMVFSMWAARRGDAVVLDPTMAVQFNHAVAKARQELDAEATREDQQVAATRLWELAGSLYQPPPPGGQSALPRS